MEAWFAADADMISLQTWDQASAVSYLSRLIVLWLLLHKIDTIDGGYKDLKFCK
jgi:hypothetical protein